MDPISAFAAAQAAVAGIKKAVQLGKDINSLYKEFSGFYLNADTVHMASSKAKIAMAVKGKTDAQLNAEALEIAMASKALRDNERELKDILFWSGNAQVWEEMMSERTRMTKLRNQIERAEEEKKLADRKAMYELMMNLLYITGGLMVIIPVISGTVHLIYNRGF